jgi:hypothetical protein
MFRLISEAVSRVVPIERLRRITFGHVEAGECGSMNQWLAAAPRSEVAHGAVGVMVSLNDLADRPPWRFRTPKSSTWVGSGSVTSTRRMYRTGRRRGDQVVILALTSIAHEKDPAASDFTFKNRLMKMIVTIDI